MKLNELDKNKVYTVTHRERYYIFKQGFDINDCFNICEDRFYTGGSFGILDNDSKSLYTVKEANRIETQWLEECILQNTFVAVNKIIKQINYEIY